jgi:hypothetical protein
MSDTENDFPFITSHYIKPNFHFDNVDDNQDQQDDAEIPINIIKPVESKQIIEKKLIKEQREKVVTENHPSINNPIVKIKQGEKIEVYEDNKLIFSNKIAADFVEPKSEPKSQPKFQPKFAKKIWSH